MTPSVALAVGLALGAVRFIARRRRRSRWRDKAELRGPALMRPIRSPGHRGTR